jgi:hypothetical protein
MNTGTIALMFCAASLMIGCGGSSTDSTGSAVDTLRGQANARADAGGGPGSGGGSGAGNGGQGAGGVHPCKPVGTGPSPCAHDDGGDLDDASDIDKDAGGNPGNGNARDDGGGRPADAGKR